MTLWRWSRVPMGRAESMMSRLQPTATTMAKATTSTTTGSAPGKVMAAVMVAGPAIMARRGARWPSQPRRLRSVSS